MQQKDATLPALCTPPGAKPLRFACTRFPALENAVPGAAKGQRVPGGEEVRLVFSHQTAVNTVALGEIGANCVSVSLYGEDANGQRQLLYQSDGIGRMLYCVFDTAQVCALVLTVRGEAGRAVHLRFLQAYCLHRGAKKDFRVTVYYPLDTGSNYFSSRTDDPDLLRDLDLITDLVLIGGVRFLKNGQLQYDEKTLTRELAALRQIIGGRPVRIWYCILNPPSTSGRGRLSNRDSVFAIRRHLGTLIENIVSFCEKYDFCGIDFDWEFPYLPHIWRLHGKLLVELKKALLPRGRLLSAAFAPWNIWLQPAAKESLDFVNVMAYDWPKNRRRYHAEFYSCHVFSAAYFLKKNFPKKKLLLGVPFYGNTCDRKKLAQRDYSGFDVRDAWQNTGTFDGRPYYFNSCAMIRSKAAYTRDFGFGGVMVWCGMGDRARASGLSLFEALKTGLDLSSD